MSPVIWEWNRTHCCNLYAVTFILSYVWECHITNFRSVVISSTPPTCSFGKINLMAGLHETSESNFIILPRWRLCSRRFSEITLGRDNCSNLERFIMAFLTENSSNKRNGLSIREILLTRILIRLLQVHGAIQISKSYVPDLS